MNFLRRIFSPMKRPTLWIFAVVLGAICLLILFVLVYG